MPRRRIVLAALFLLLTAGEGAESARAAKGIRLVRIEGPRYGRYERRVSDLGPFVLYFEERYRKMAGEIELLLSSSSGEISGGTGLERIDTFDVFIATDRADFDRLHGHVIPEWGEAFSDMRRMLIGISAEDVLRTPRPLEVVVRHEMSHMYLSQRTGNVRCPTWFVEGVAMIQSREWTLVDEWNLAVSVWRRNLPDLEDLGSGFPRPAAEANAAYRLSYAAIRSLIGERPEELVTLTSFIRDTRDFEKAFLLTFGRSSEDFTLVFHLDLEKKYRMAGVLMESAPYWSILAVLFIAAFIVKKTRSRRKLKEWESMPAAEPERTAPPR